METPTLVTFTAYFIGLTGIGLYFWHKNRNVEDYLLGGRGMGAWVTALSAQASDKEVVFVGRVCVIVISVIAMTLALNPRDSILNIVAYAWGGLGAAFGPLVLSALFCKRTTWQAALAGMVCGTVVLVVWKQAGLSAKMYELVPGFVANSVTILIANHFFAQSNTDILNQYEEVLRTHETNKSQLTPIDQC